MRVTETIGTIYSNVKNRLGSDDAQSKAANGDSNGSSSPDSVTLGKLDTKTDVPYDGHFVGQKGQTFAPDTPFHEIPAMQPSNGKQASETIVWVNGILTDLALERQDMQGVADEKGVNVIGIHNSTDGAGGDLVQCLTDKLGWRDNKAVQTTERILQHAMDENQPLHLVGHSQGGLILSRALTNVSERMVEEGGLSKQEAAQELSGLKVTTLGGAGANWVSGPEYQHHINRADIVPMLTGVGLDALNPFANAGEGAEIHKFTEVEKPHDLPAWSTGIENRLARTLERTIHGAGDIYLEEWNLSR